MTTSPFIFCCVCGTAKQSQATQCSACGHPVEACVEETALPPLLADLPVSPTLLARGYRLRALVGKGGFGAVYQAEDVRHPGRRVALKQITLKGLGQEQVIEATDTFNREVGLLSGLAHPNLPRIYEQFADAEHWYLVMDFIEGETLEASPSHATGGHLAVEEVLAIGIQLCSVLSYLHIQKPPIIFRDVKPANVMRTATKKEERKQCLIKQIVEGTMSSDYLPNNGYGKRPSSSRRALLRWGLAAGVVAAVGRAFWWWRPQPVPLYILRRGALSLAWSPDGTRIAAAGAGRDRTIRIWTASDGRPLSIYRGHPLASNIAWSPDSTRLASVGLDQAVQVWNAGNGKLIWTYRDPTEHDLAFRAVAWSPDGTRIATIGVGQDIQIWNAADGRLISTYRGLPFACSLAWSPDGTRIASGGWNRSVQVWRVEEGKPIWTYQITNADNYDINTVNAIAWSPDGTRIASGGSRPLILFASNKGVQVWDASTGKRLLTYWGHPESSDIEAVAWSPNGKSIASGGTDNAVQVWEPTTGNQVLTYSHPNWVSAIAWSPDSTRIASGGGQVIGDSPPNNIQVWKLP